MPTETAEGKLKAPSGRTLIGFNERTIKTDDTKGKLNAPKGMEVILFFCKEIEILPYVVFKNFITGILEI